MNLRKILGTAGGMFLGVVLLVAAWAKAIDPFAFAEQIRLEKLDFLLPAAVVAVIALAIEVGLGTALLLGVRKLSVLLPSTLLVVFFVFLTGRNWWLDAQGLLEEGVGCGCFGNLVERTPAQAFWQDLGLMVPALMLAFLARPSGRTKLRSAIAGVLAATAVLFSWQAPHLPLDNLATRLKPGVETAAICAGQDGDRVCLDGLMPELDEGRHWVVLADVEEEAFGEIVTALNDWVLGGLDDGLWVATGSEPEAVQALQFMYAPAFRVREAPPGLLKPLYRTLPRSFLVENGVVTDTITGLPPAASIGVVEGG